MTSLWARLRASRPFTWQSIVWMGLGMLIFSPRILVGVLGHDLWTWRAVMLVTLTGESLLTLLVVTFVVKKRTIGDSPVLMWALIVGLSWAFPMWFRISAVYIFQLEYTPPGLFRFFTSSIIWMLGTLVFAVAVSETRQFHTDLGRLKAQLAQEKWLVEMETVSLEKVRSKIVNEVREVLRSAFEKMQKDSHTLRVTNQLEDLIDEVVRPLAQKLSATPTTSGDIVQTMNVKIDDRVHMKDVLSRLTEINPFDYVLTPFLISFSTVFIKTWTMPLHTALWSSALSVMIASLLLFVGHTIFDLRQRNGRLRLSATGLVVIFLVISFLNTISVRVMLGIEPSASSLILVFIEFGVLILMAIIRAVPLQRQEVISQIAKTLEATQWINSRLAQMNWVEHQRFGRLVHGDIQSRILATSLEARLGSPQGGPSTSFLAALQSQCEQALAAPLQSSSFSKFLTSLTTIWQATVAITYDISEDVLDAIDADPIARDAAVEIVRESLNNAVKHVGASAIHIAVDDEVYDSELHNLAHKNLVLRVRSTTSNKYRPRLRTTTDLMRVPGQGTGIYDVLTTLWSLDISDNQTLLTAVIPIGERAPSHPW